MHPPTARIQKGKVGRCGLGLKTSPGWRTPTLPRCRALSTTAPASSSAQKPWTWWYAAEELNYLPNTVAGSLAGTRSSTIGAVIGDLAVPLFAHMIRGIDDVTSTAAYTALVVNTDNDPEREYRHLRNLEERRVDGLIVTTWTLNDPDGCQRFSPVAPQAGRLLRPHQAPRRARAPAGGSAGTGEAGRCVSARRPGRSAVPRLRHGNTAGDAAPRLGRYRS